MPHSSIRISCFVAVLVILTTLAASAAIELLDASYRPDRRIPEWDYFWKNTYVLGGSTVPVYPSGALAVYVKNTGAGSVTISDMTINGQGLSDGIRCATDKAYKCNLNACSVFYGGGGPRQTLINAGEPIWWRVDPNPVPAGGTAEVFTYMRERVPGTVSLSVLSNGGNISTSVVISSDSKPRFSGYGLSPDSATLYLYLRHTTKGMLPTTILIDGVDRTAYCTMNGDSKIDIAVVKCTLASAFTRGTHHVFQAVYSDGSRATQGLRVYRDNWKYCLWSSPALANDTERHTYFHELENRSFNTQTMGAADFSDFMKTQDGHSHMDAIGFKKINDEDSDRMYGLYTCDEIDGGDSNVPTSVVPATIGALSQAAWNQTKSWQDSMPQYPTILNMAANYKPYNYYIYGQLPNILSVDPYYQQRIRDVYYTKPHLMPFYRKATYIYAISSTCQAACEPRPLHVILSIFRDVDPDKRFRIATPEEKRIEAYYAIAGGAKQLDYWWMHSSNGIGNATEPDTTALWRELGLIGAEAGLAGDIIVNSCPAEFPITKSGKLWVKALVSSDDTVMLLCVNDDYACDDAGTIVQSIENAQVSFDLPSWISAPTNVFEIDYKGVRNVVSSIASGKITLDLGRVDVTRMIIITKNSTLNSTLSSLYTNTYRPRVATLIPLP